RGAHTQVGSERIRHLMLHADLLRLPTEAPEPHARGISRVRYQLRSPRNAIAIAVPRIGAPRDRGFVDSLEQPRTRNLARDADRRRELVGGIPLQLEHWLAQLHRCPVGERNVALLEALEQRLPFLLLQLIAEPRRRV